MNIPATERHARVVVITLTIAYLFRAAGEIYEDGGCEVRTQIVGSQEQ